MVNWYIFFFITPHICGVTGVIVLTSCVCVSPSQTERHTNLNFGMEVKWQDI